ncbi:MAG: hypothetical protein NVS1B4_23010 [Gemmatimonadaceae bacterium]
MSPLFRDSRDDESSWSTGAVLGIAVGALAGLVAGVALSQRLGGWSGVAERFRRRGQEMMERGFPFGSDTSPEAYDGSFDEELEERVLDAFRNDPILAERAVDIGSLGEGIIELAGWVNDEAEARHAVTLARGVPDVHTVVNRLAIGAEEDELDDVARRVAEGDPSLTEAHWEGQHVGTGRRRQGSSAEPDRHTTPRNPLEDKWQSEDIALQNAADEMTAAERKAKKGKGGAKEDGIADRG